VIGLERAGRLVAGVAGLVHEGAFRTISLTAYHGLWLRDEGLSPSAAESLVAEVAHVLVPFLNERHERWAFACAPEFRDPRLFSELNCHVDVHCTLRLPIREPKAMLEHITSTARRNIRRAERDGVLAKACEPTEENIAIFERHGRHVTDRMGLSANECPKGLFANIARASTSAGNGQLFVSWTKEGEPASSLLCTWDRHRAYDFLGGNDPMLMRSGSPRLTMWTAVNWFWEQGYEEMDLVGANLPQLRLHKREWNATVTPYFTISRGDTPSLSRTDHLRQAAKHLFRSITG
jgi:hypothetical protein